MEQKSHTPNHSVASQQTDNQPPTLEPSNTQRSSRPKWTDRITGQVFYGMTNDYGPLPPTWKAAKGCITLFRNGNDGGTLIVCPYIEGLPNQQDGETIPLSEPIEADKSVWDKWIEFRAGGQRIKLTKPHPTGVSDEGDTEARSMMPDGIDPETANKFDWGTCENTLTEDLDDHGEIHGDEHGAL